MRSLYILSLLQEQHHLAVCVHEVLVYIKLASGTTSLAVHEVLYILSLEQHHLAVCVHDVLVYIKLASGTTSSGCMCT